MHPFRYLCVHWAHAPIQVPMRALSTCTHSGTYACTEHTHQIPMRALSIPIRYLCVHWAYPSGTYMRALSIPIRYLCMHWAYPSDTHACTEHTHQIPMHALSIPIGYLWVHWAYPSDTYTCTDQKSLQNMLSNEQMRKVLMHAASTEHKQKELMRKLSMRIRNWILETWQKPVATSNSWQIWQPFRLVSNCYNQPDNITLDLILTLQHIFQLEKSNFLPPG